MTDKIQEILDITQEEAAEVIQVISKIKRFGLGANYARDEKFQTNIDALNGEVGDLLAMIDLLKSHGVLDEKNLEQAKQAKFEKLKIWSKIYE